MELIVERSIVCGTVLIGSASAARLWQRLLRVSLGVGLGQRNASEELCAILNSFKAWLKECFFYSQVEKEREECTSLIQVHRTAHMDPNHLLSSDLFFTGHAALGFATRSTASAEQGTATN